MSLQTNTVSEVNHSTKAESSEESIEKSSLIPECNHLEPVENEENEVKEKNQIHRVIHASPSSEDERVNSGSVSLPMEEHNACTPQIDKSELKLEYEKSESEEEMKQEKNVRGANDNYPIEFECNTVKEKNEVGDEESDGEDAVLLIGCVKSANEAIELVRKCQRNYYKNYCPLKEADDKNNDGANKVSTWTTSRYERTRESETLGSKEHVNENSKHAQSLNHTSMPSNGSKYTKNKERDHYKCHDLPITLQEFAKQTQCSVSLFVTRSAVFADALTGFTSEAQREQREEFRLRQLYMEQLQQEQQEKKQPEQPSQTTTLSREVMARNHNRQTSHDAQTREYKLWSIDSSKVNNSYVEKNAQATSVMASESPLNKGETEELLEIPSCTATSCLSSKQQYFLFMRDKLSQNRNTPYFLRHKYPVYERYSLSPSRSGAATQGKRVNIAVDDHNYHFNNNNSSNNSEDHALERRNQIVIGNDQVAREWRFVWKQFKRDISREVFVVQESVLNNAEDAAVIVLSYLEYAFDRGSADAFARLLARKNSMHKHNTTSSQNNFTPCPYSSSAINTSSTWEETISQSNNGYSNSIFSNNNYNTQQTRISNRDVFRSLLSAGSAAVKEALTHAQAALPEFVVEPIRDVIIQLKNNNNNDTNDTNNDESLTDSWSSTRSYSNNDNVSQGCGTRSTLSRLREMWQARIESKEIRSIYPPSIKEKGRKVFAAAREVVLAGQQSFLAFPYMLLYEQIGMHALACATPLPSRNVTSSDDDEHDDDDNDDGDVNDNGQQKGGGEANDNNQSNVNGTEMNVNESARRENDEKVTISSNNNISNDEMEKESSDDEWSILADLEKLTATKETVKPTIDVVTESNTMKEHHAQNRFRRHHHFKRNEPLMIGEPAVCDLHKFCEHIRKKLQRKDATSGDANFNKSLFREDVDGSVFLLSINSPGESTSSSNKSETICPGSVMCENSTQEDETEHEKQKEQLHPSHKRGTRIHLYYSPLRGVPVVCVSKLFRLYTLS